MGVFLSKQVLKLLENVKSGDLISVDWCDASVGKLLRELISLAFAVLALLVGWMLGSSSFLIFCLKRAGVYEGSTLDC